MASNRNSGVKRSISKNNASLGSLAFLFGAAIAIISGIINPLGTSTMLVSLLIILGLLVGLLNVTKRESNSFLMATVSLVIVSWLGGAVLGDVARIGIYLEGVLTSILTFVIPASIVVAIKSIYVLEEEK